MGSSSTDPDPARLTVIAEYGPTAPPAKPGASDDWSTAVLLPDSQSVIVKGNPSPGALPDLLQIDVKPATWTIDFTFKSAWDDRPVAETLQIFDAQFNEYASFTPDPSHPSFAVTLSVWSQSPLTVYVKIGLPAEAGRSDGLEKQDSESFAYTLEVTRHEYDFSDGEYPSDGDTSGWYENGNGDGDGDGGSAPAEGGLGGDPGTTPREEIEIPSISPEPVDPVEPSAPPPNQDDAQTQIEPPANSLPVAVGPLPTRSAAPLGGVLAAPESVPPVDRHEGARADLAMFDPAQYLVDPAFDPRQVVPVGGPPAEPEAVKILALRGPGGLPVLATALIAGATTKAARAAASGGVQAEATSDAPADTSTAYAVAHSQGRSTSAERASTAASSTHLEIEASARASSRRNRQASVVPGLTLAFALGVGLVLPDLVAAMQFHEPVRPSLRLKWIRRALGQSR